MVEHENLRLSHFKFNLLKTSGRRINNPIANKFVLYLKLHQGSRLLPKAMRYRQLVKLACYKDPLKKTMAALCRCEKDTTTAVAWPPLEQDKLNSVRIIRGAVQKN